MPVTLKKVSVVCWSNHCKQKAQAVFLTAQEDTYRLHTFFLRKRSQTPVSHRGD